MLFFLICGIALSLALFARHLGFNSSNACLYSYIRAYGYSVRYIKE